ncbi:MAG: NFACT family protein [Lachnospiraceae bacterium]|nr:NFACT family protein [Lachnospiraceae bacterium]
MAFDGISVAALVKELNDKLTDGRISKIAQPETDAVLLTVKNGRNQYRLLLSANPSLPLAYLTENNLPSPAQAPGFLMLLRKHLAGGRIVSVTQPGLERVILLTAEHFNELGDSVRHRLILELMGKHSNLILADQEDVITDAIRRIGSGTSSVREVLPGRPYFIPNTRDKLSPLDLDAGLFREKLSEQTGPAEKAAGAILTGISPQMARELILQASLSGDESAASLTEAEILRLEKAVRDLAERILAGRFAPQIYYHNGQLIEYSAFPLMLYAAEEAVPYESISELLSDYYAEKNSASRIKQKSADLRHVLHQTMERDSRKRELMEKQLKDAEKRDKYKLYGELIQAYGYGLETGARELKAQNYYDGNKEITIPLDETLTPQENAKHYFDRYQKLKRTYDATLTQLEETDAELAYLRSVEAALNLSESEEDLNAIKAELIAGGYLRAKNVPGRKAPKTPKTAAPLHYVCEEGFDYFVGKNNLQNETVTFELASGNDWWFHVKGIAGSHVIVKTGTKELSDAGFERAAALAAWYSSAPKGAKTEVDYTRRRELKKPGNYKPGMVIYHTNYSMVVEPGLEGLMLV